MEKASKPRRTTMQSVQGKLCAALFESQGESVLPTFEKIYGEYGEELGAGLQKRSGSNGLEQAAKALQDMFDQAALPAEATFDGERIHWEGRLCPFGLENTHRKVCEAVMAIDLEMTRQLVGVSRGQLGITIDKTMAGGDECCRGTYFIKE